MAFKKIILFSFTNNQLIAFIFLNSLLPNETTNIPISNYHYIINQEYLQYISLEISVRVSIFSYFIRKIIFY